MADDNVASSASNTHSFQASTDDQYAEFMDSISRDFPDNETSSVWASQCRDSAGAEPRSSSPLCRDTDSSQQRLLEDHDRSMRRIEERRSYTRDDETRRAPRPAEYDDDSAPIITDTSATPANSRPSTFWEGIIGSFQRRQLPISFSDGVFGNLVAKDENTIMEEQEAGMAGENDGSHNPGDDENDDLTPAGHPPTYEEASADATPSYWESTILAAGYGDEIIVGDMPVGSVIIFILNLLLCAALGYFGFFLGYMFHTTHAGKNGSLAGLGSLMIFSSRDLTSQEIAPNGPAPVEFAPVDPNSFEDGPSIGYVMYPTGRDAQPPADQNSSSTMGHVLLWLGITIIVYAFVQYWCALVAYYRIKRQQTIAEGNTYESPSEALRNTWDNIYYFAMRSRRDTDTPPASSDDNATPPPGSSPGNPHSSENRQVEEV